MIFATITSKSSTFEEKEHEAGKDQGSRYSGNLEA